MSVAPSYSGGRGELAVQPSYFTSSLFVNPLRHDISNLVTAYEAQYIQSTPVQSPFVLFKSIWTSQGWIWIHLKVLERRAREAFLQVTSRLFLERVLDSDSHLKRVAALFGLYTFFFSQPSGTTPPIHSIKHIAIPYDHYSQLLALPNDLSGDLVQRYVGHILSKLLEAGAFYIAPSSTMHPLNPRVLPREVVVSDDQDASGSLSVEGTSKKKGRPSKRDKAKKAKDALLGLEKWLETTDYTAPAPPPTSTQPGSSEPPMSTHVLISRPPVNTRLSYRSDKYELLHMLTSVSPAPENGNVATSVLERANQTVVARLRRIDRLAAEQGLEIGSEGGDRTGLGRVERVVEELGKERGSVGILGLLEGAGVVSGDREMAAEECEPMS